MTATELKNIIKKRISGIDDIEVLNSINQILESNGSDNEVYHLNEEQKRRIKKSQQQFKEGNTISNEKVFDEIEKWLSERSNGQ